MPCNRASNSDAWHSVEQSGVDWRKKSRGMPIWAFPPDVEPHVTTRQPNASERIDSAIVAGPTCSNTTSTPSPVACLTAALKPVESNTASAPSSCALPLGLGAARHEYARAEMAGDLDGGDGDTRARADHEHCLVGL